MSYNDKRRCYSAGILPYTIRNNEIYYLLGRDWRDEGWSDFGGKVEDRDKNNTIKTAMREFYEETMGSVLSYTELVPKFNQHTRHVTSITLNGSPYHMYILPIDDNDYSIFFDKIYNFIVHSKINDTKYIEKNEICWLSSSKMKLNTKEYKLRNIFKKTLNRCNESLRSIENDILKEHALKV